MRYKDAVQVFVDHAAPLLEKEGDVVIRYILLDVLDVLYHQGALNESPLSEYSDGLGPFGQNLLLWTHLENLYIPDGVDKGIYLWKLWEQSRPSIKALECYVKIVRDIPYIPLSSSIDDPAIALCRLIAQTSYNRLMINPPASFISEEEHVIKILFGTAKLQPSFPMSQLVFRVQQQLLGVLTKSSDLNYLCDKIWMVNAQLYFTVMAWKFQTLTGDKDLFSPLLSIFSYPGKQHV